MNIHKLPNNIVRNLISYLDWKDLLSLKVVSKQVSRLFAEDKRFWARECLRFYFSFELEIVDDLYMDKLYKSSIKQVFANFSDEIWKHHFISGKNITQGMEKLLTQAVSSGKAKLFTAYILEGLKEPDLSVLTLKRENILCETNSMFQNKLSEVVYEDSGLLCSVERATSRPIRKILEQVFSQCKINGSKVNLKSELIKARWYDFENFELDEERTKNHESKTLSLSYSPETINKSSLELKFLLDFLMGLQRMLTHHCSMVHDCLREIGNGYDLINEYHARWNVYVSAMLDFEATLKPFVDCFNEAYEECFEGFPSFPKFSIWRLMAKIWITHVYEKENMSRLLEESFFKIFTNQRVGAVAQALENNFNYGCTDQSAYYEMPKSLYLNLNGKNETFELNRLNSVEATDHPFFSSHQEAEKRILSNFVQAMIDLSSNEVSIHFIENSEVTIYALNNTKQLFAKKAQLNYPYQELEERILHFTNAFYEEYQESFKQSPNYFSYFLKSDLRFLTEILPERTLSHLKKLQIQNLEIFHKNFTMDLVSVLNTTRILEQVDKDSESPLTKRRLNQLASSFLQENTTCIQDLQDFRKASSHQHADDNKVENALEKLRPQIWTWMEKSSGDFAENFEYLKNMSSDLAEERLQNEIILKENLEKNLPAELSDIDRLFYDLEKNVDVTLLCKLSADKKGLSLSSVLSEIGDSHRQLKDSLTDVGCSEDFDATKEYLTLRDHSPKMPLTSILRKCIVSSSVIKAVIHHCSI